MPSYSSWNGERCSGHKRLLTDILKTEFGFEGFLISDYNALDQLPGSRKDQIAASINAGMDMAMVPQSYAEFYKLLLELVQEGRVPQSRIDDAVLRILKVKFAMGLMDPKRNHLADRSLHKSFGSPDHRTVARQCVRESLVVLKNDKKLLPLKKGTKVHVAGAAADDIGIQCGGWTIAWQGKAGAITKGTTLLEGFKKSGLDITYSADGSGAAGATAAIAVIGEKPYAEMFGDRTDLKLPPADVELVTKLKSQGIPVTVVILSGRPLVIDDILDKADAIVAAWLPGTEGDGVADVLTGAFKPKGKLSYTWPSGKSTSFARSDPVLQSALPVRLRADILAGWIAVSSLPQPRDCPRLLSIRTPKHLPRPPAWRLPVAPPKWWLATRISGSTCGTRSWWTAISSISIMAEFRRHPRW